MNRYIKHMCLWGASALAALWICLPTFWKDLRDMPISASPVILGLDLQGGVHLLCEIDILSVLKEYYAPMASDIKNDLRSRKLWFQKIACTSQGIVIDLVESTSLQSVKDILSQKYPYMSYSIEGQRVLLCARESFISDMTIQSVQKSIDVIRRRIDESATKDVKIFPQSKDRIVIEIPGCDDPKRMRALLGKTAKLSFHWIYDAVSQASGSESVTYVGMRELSENSGERYSLEALPCLSGEEILDASGQFSENGDPVVSFVLTHKGAGTFSDLTRSGIGRRLAIVLDRKVLTAPTVESHIQGGRAVINGMHSLEEASDLALMIRSGALPAPLQIIEEKIIGPGLGHDSIVQGVQATIFAVIAVSIMMIWVYRRVGMIAIAGLGLNILFLLSMVILGHITLTLPGIAGIALTIGMAVDSNVLINERIRECYHSEEDITSIVRKGYEEAMRSIFDSNFTGLIGAVILYWLGRGPVRGFAVTVGIGILSSIISSVYATRPAMILWYSRLSNSGKEGGVS